MASSRRSVPSSAAPSRPSGSSRAAAGEKLKEGGSSRKTKAEAGEAEPEVVKSGKSSSKSPKTSERGDGEASPKAKRPSGRAGGGSERSSRNRERDEVAEDGEAVEERPSRRRAPPAQAPKALWIFLGVVCLGVLIAAGNMIASRNRTPNVIKVDFATKELAEVDRLVNEGERVYKQALAGDEAAKKSGFDKADRLLREAAERFDKAMEPHTLSNGMLAEGYERYGEKRQRIQQLLSDLMKNSSLE